MTGTQLGALQPVPQTTVPPPLPQTTVSPPPLPQTTVSTPPLPQTTVSPLPLPHTTVAPTTCICHGPEQSLPPQLIPQTTFSDSEAVSHRFAVTPLLQSGSLQSTPKSA